MSWAGRVFVAGFFCARVGLEVVCGWKRVGGAGPVG